MKKGAFFLFIFLLPSCGSETDLSQSSGCDENAALISVRESSFQNQCGCDETVGKITHSGEPFSCTVTLGTKVIFDFSESSVSHQIVSNGGKSLPAGPIHDPGEKTVHGIDPSETGTYLFKDAFNATLKGQIVVY